MPKRASPAKNPQTEEVQADLEAVSPNKTPKYTPGEWSADGLDGRVFVNRAINPGTGLPTNSVRVLLEINGLKDVNTDSSSNQRYRRPRPRNAPAAISENGPPHGTGAYNSPGPAD